MPSSEMLEIIGPALAAGLVIALVHAPLGIEVLRRGIIFIDLAVAQIAGLGLVLAGILFHNANDLIAQITALLCALLGGLFFRGAERWFAKQLEAIIGCSFVVSASLALLLLADEPHGGEEIQHLLSGQILFVTWDDVVQHLPVYSVILLLWFVRPTVRGGIWFYLLFSLAITSSVQLVGVYVVFASLILPALACIGATSGAYRWSWLCGLLAITAGIFISTLVDLPAGPFLVISYTGSCALILAIRRCWQGNLSVVHDIPGAR